jgi:hypothetical protein
MRRTARAANPRSLNRVFEPPRQGAQRMREAYERLLPTLQVRRFPDRSGPVRAETEPAAKAPEGSHEFQKVA